MFLDAGLCLIRVSPLPGLCKPNPTPSTPASPPHDSHPHLPPLTRRQQRPTPSFQPTLPQTILLIALAEALHFTTMPKQACQHLLLISYPKLLPKLHPKLHPMLHPKLYPKLQDPNNSLRLCNKHRASTSKQGHSSNSNHHKGPSRLTTSSCTSSFISSHMGQHIPSRRSNSSSSRLSNSCLNPRVTRMSINRVQPMHSSSGSSSRCSGRLIMCSIH